MKTDVIVISPEFGYGGIGTHTLKIVKFLLEEGFRVCVHTTNRSKKITKFFHPNLQVMVVASPILGFDKFNPFFDLLSSIYSRSERPDLIIRPTTPYYFYIPQFRNAKIPELVITHDTFANLSHFLSEEKELKERFASSKLSIPLIESEKLILGKAKRIVAISEYTKRMLTDYYDIEKERISVIHNPVDINKFRRKKTEEITSEVGVKVKAFKNESMLAVFVGRPAGVKNLRLLYNVIARSYDENLKFVIVGISEDDKYAKNYLRSMKGYNVLCLGYIDNNLLPDIFSLAEFLILTSFYENLPTSLIEAMACGTIPISLNVGGISEVIRKGENGFLVHNSEKDFLHIMREIMSQDNTLNLVSRNAEKSAREKFDSQIIKKKFINLINEIIE